MLEKPRRLWVMIKAGKPVDEVLNQLKPLLDPGDIVIDGGNTHFEETRRREADLKQKGIRFVGMGVSGGEEGARRGPSLMPGGDKDAWESLKPILESIAAKTDSGPCVTHVGPDGAGHFVKMVHNGIEYGDMQLIAEAYDMLGRGLGLSAPEMGDIFARWNEGPLASFLIELTGQVLKVKDEETGKPLVDLVQDKAGQKGTGKWTADLALDLGVPVPTIGAALDGRGLSSMKEAAGGGLEEDPRRHRARARRRREGSADPGGARCAAGLEDLLLRPGPAPHQGGQRPLRMGHLAEGDGPHLERRLHHPGAAAGRHHARPGTAAHAAQPAGRRGVRAADVRGPARLAARP